MRNIFAFILCSFFIVGCASQSTVKIGGYSNNLSSDLEIMGRYEIIFKARDGKIIVGPFLSDCNYYLPNNVLRLHLGLKVINPNKEKFKIWVEARFAEIDTNEEFKIIKYAHGAQMLSEEFISIGLPMKENVQVTFNVKVISEVDKILYESSTAKYKTRKHKKT